MASLFEDEARLPAESERELSERRPPSEDDYETVRVSEKSCISRLIEKIPFISFERKAITVRDHR